MQATRTFSGLVATASEQVAVAELMAPSESLVARPPLCIPRAAGFLLALLLLASPSEPADDED